MIQLAKQALTGIKDDDLEAKYLWEQGFTYEAYSYPDSQEAQDAFVGIAMQILRKVNK